MAQNKRNYDRKEAFEKFGSKLRRRPFVLVNKAQQLYAEISSASANASRDYRLTICQDVRLEAKDLLHAISRANSEPRGDMNRVKAQYDVLRRIENVYDVLPSLKMCKCITPTNEAKIEDILLYVKATFEGWLKSDLRIMTENKMDEEVMRELKVLIGKYFPDDPKDHNVKHQG